jgi:hypothetical protein
MCGLVSLKLGLGLAILQKFVNRCVISSCPVAFYRPFIINQARSRVNFENDVSLGPFYGPQWLHKSATVHNGAITIICLAM